MDYKQNINGINIYVSNMLVEDGEPYNVKRTWRERLFTLPWQPLRSYNRVIPKVPANYSIKLPNGGFVMHPEMYKVLAELEDKE